MHRGDYFPDARRVPAAHAPAGSSPADGAARARSSRSGARGATGGNSRRSRSSRRCLWFASSASAGPRSTTAGRWPRATGRRCPAKFPRGDAGMKALVDRIHAAGLQGAALVEPARGRSGIPDRARASGVAAAESGRLDPRDHLVGRALPLSGARQRARGRRGLRPQGARRVGIRRPEDRRPAPERRAARASRRARARVAGGGVGGRPRVFPRDLGRGHRDATRCGRRDLPVRHRVLVLHPAVPQHDGRLRSGELVAGPAEGQDAEGAPRGLHRVLRRPRRAVDRRRGLRLDPRCGRRRGHQFRVARGAGQEGPDAPADPERGGEMGLLDQALPGEAALAGRISGRALRHRLRPSRGPRRPQRGRPLLRVLRRSIRRERSSCAGSRAAATAFATTRPAATSASSRGRRRHSARPSRITCSWRRGPNRSASASQLTPRVRRSRSDPSGSSFWWQAHRTGMAHALDLRARRARRRPSQARPGRQRQPRLADLPRHRPAGVEAAADEDPPGVVAERQPEHARNAGDAVVGEAQHEPVWPFPS